MHNVIHRIPLPWKSLATRITAETHQVVTHSLVECQQTASDRQLTQSQLMQSWAIGNTLCKSHGQPIRYEANSQGHSQLHLRLEAD